MKQTVDLVVLSIYDGCYYFGISTEREMYDRIDLDHKKEHKLKELAEYIYKHSYDYDINEIKTIISKNYDFKKIIICDNGSIEIKENLWNTNIW